MHQSQIYEAILDTISEELIDVHQTNSDDFF